MYSRRLSEGLKMNFLSLMENIYEEEILMCCLFGGRLYEMWRTEG